MSQIARFRTSGLAMNFSAWISFDLFTLSMEMGFGPTPAREQAWPQNGCTAQAGLKIATFPGELQLKGAKPLNPKP